MWDKPGAAGALACGARLVATARFASLRVVGGVRPALLAFGPEAPSGAAITRNLSPSGDLREAAANLFAMLRELDAAEISAIAVMAVPETGLGAAINDRLRRGAAPLPAAGEGD